MYRKVSEELSITSKSCLADFEQFRGALVNDENGGSEDRDRRACDESVLAFRKVIWDTHPSATTFLSPPSPHR